MLQYFRFASYKPYMIIYNRIRLYITIKLLLVILEHYVYINPYVELIKCIINVSQGQQSKGLSLKQEQFEDLLQDLPLP